MNYVSHAHLKPRAKARRIKELVRELESYGCTVHVHYGAKRLDLELDDSLERWIVLGGLHRLLDKYDDCLSWSPNFSSAEKVDC